MFQRATFRILRHLVVDVDDGEAAFGILRLTEQQIVERIEATAPAVNALHRRSVAGAAVHALIHPHAPLRIEADDGVGHAHLVHLRRGAFRHDGGQGHARRRVDAA